MIKITHTKSLMFMFTIIFFFTTISLPLTGNANEDPSMIWDESIDVEPDKTWTIKFNDSVDPTTVHDDSVYVVDALGNKISKLVQVSSGMNQITVPPPSGGYTHSTTYTLHITDAIKDLRGNPLKKAIRKNFTIKSAPTYDLASIQSDGTTSILQTFSSYEEAVANRQANQVILHEDAIIKMSSGIVVTKPTSTSVLTIIYSDKQLNRQETYVPNDTEFQYIDSTDTYVEVNVAGQNRFIKHENSTLLPQNTVHNQSYYSNSNGSLIHSIYSHSTGKFASYQMGIAPSFMQNGERYYSSNGSHFTTKDGAAIGTAYQYFQYLPIRSETHYTAEEIDAYLLTMLTKLETENPNNPTYQNAFEKSKLIGIGAFLKQIEEEYKINALHILALAQHESAYGLSSRALQYNNLFGLYVTDNNPQAKYFDTVEQNIQELVTAFLNKNYIPPNAAYAYGAVFGNKAIGFNVKYASDPYWGSKAAGHLYRIDQMMGGKELANPHKLGITTTTGLNVRTGPGTQNPIAYTYAKSGMPIILIDDNLPEQDWIKIRSDSTQYEELYVHRSYIEVLNVSY